MKYLADKDMFIYEVGDKVTVISRPLADGKAYPTGVNNYDLEWVYDMEKFCGQLVEIDRVDPRDGTYQIVEDEDGFWWCNTFFEDPPSIIDEDGDSDVEIQPCRFDGYLDNFAVTY